MPGKGYTLVPDRFLPFEVVHEHKTRVVNDDGSVENRCEPNRKWSYCASPLIELGTMALR